MEKVSSYGIGCGSLLLMAGVINLIGIALGWGESNRAVFQILKIVGNMVGSQALGSGIYIAAGLVLILAGWALSERQGEKQLTKTGATRSQGLPTAQQFQADEQNKIESYLSFIEDNLIRGGFELVLLPQGNKAFYKKESSRSSEFYFIPGRVNGQLTPEKVEKISQKTFEYVSKNKRANTLYCYPVIVSEAVPAPAQKFIKSYNPKHMAQFEFPVIVDLSARKLFYYTGTPLWGGMMYRGIRENADILLKIPKW